jgi:hypothetical protein
VSHVDSVLEQVPDEYRTMKGIQLKLRIVSVSEYSFKKNIITGKKMSSNTKGMNVGAYHFQSYIKLIYKRVQRVTTRLNTKL